MNPFHPPSTDELSLDEAAKARLPYANRRVAGRLLASRLAFLAGEPGLIVLGLPRGGVPVAQEVARALRAPLDVLPVRKLGLPQQPEFAVGAVAPGGIWVRDSTPRHLMEAARWEQVARQERAELQRRERVYRQGRPPMTLRDRTVVLVDDGIATGATLEAAARSVLAGGPRRLVIAAPVASPESISRLAGLADEVVVGATPTPFGAVGTWYEDFAQTSDAEVLACLAAQGTLTR